MNLPSTRAACLISLFFSFYTLISYADQTGSWAAILLLTGAFLLVVAVVLAARATVVAWITVLVLLAFAGNRRKVLVARGGSITTEVVLYLAKVAIKERGVATFACVISLMVAWYSRYSMGVISMPAFGT